MAKAENFDKNMAVQSGLEQNIRWIAAPSDDINIEGLAFYQEDKALCRLPQKLCRDIEKQRPNIKELMWHTAGASLHFWTDSPFIWVRVSLQGKIYMSHMTGCAQCGCDSYVKIDNEWILAGIGKFAVDKSQYDCCIAKDLGTQMREMRINLPLYIGVQNIEVGVCENSQTKSALLSGKSVVFYGTSITQGACATRPGLAYPAIIQRLNDIPVYNFGFSGNCMCDEFMIDALKMIDNLGVLVISTEANSAPDGLMYSNLPIFLQKIRCEFSALPIFLLSAPFQPMQRFNKVFADKREQWLRFQKNEVQKFQDNNDKNIYFIDANDLIKDTSGDATCDGIHLTDSGFIALAKGLSPLIIAEV